MLDELRGISPIHGWVLLAFIVVLVGAMEAGFRLGLRRPPAGRDKRRSHGADVLAALTVLLSFLLGFSFDTASSHFERRRDVVLREANAIGTSHLRAQNLPEPQRTRFMSLLRRYADARLRLTRLQEVREAMAQAEELQREMWSEVATLDPRSHFTALLVVSLNEMIDLREERTAVVLYHRIPLVILWTLGAIAVVTMLVMGYEAGLADSRDALLTLSLAVSFSIVLVLIIDLDRPYQRTFEVSQRAMVDVRESMEPPGNGHDE